MGKMDSCASGPSSAGHDCDADGTSLEGVTCELPRQSVSTGKEGQPQGKGVPEKAPKEGQGSQRDESSGKIVQKTASASCPEEQMLWEQLLLTFTDGDRDRVDTS